MPGWDQDLLGCSLSQHAGIGFCVYAVAAQHDGTVLDNLVRCA
jgi:hypothetical protein